MKLRILFVVTLVVAACMIGALATSLVQSGGQRESDITVGEARTMIGQIMDDDARLITYLAQQSDMLNRGWLRQAMPYTFIMMGAIVVTVLLILVGMAAWNWLER